MRRPWNIVDPPVYSLATYYEGRVNMNICTYVSAISMDPKQYMVAVYHNTKTIEMLGKNGTAVLQLLNGSQAGLVRVLGKKTGKSIDKQKYLSSMEELSVWKGLPVLKNSCAYVLLEVLGRTCAGGDHDVFIFAAKGYKTVAEKGILTLQELIRKGLILG